VTDHTESSIDIAAPPDRIMAVIADLAAYPAWSDGITAVQVLRQDGDRPEAARFTLDSGIVRDTYELAYTWEGDSRVSWKLVEAESLLKALDGSYTLTPNGSGVTTVRYQLQVDVKVPMIGMMKRKAEKVIIDTALKGLKKRVEATASDSV